MFFWVFMGVISGQKSPIFFQVFFQGDISLINTIFDYRKSYLDKWEKYFQVPSSQNDPQKLEDITLEKCLKRCFYRLFPGYIKNYFK